MTDRPKEEIHAGFAFRERLVHRADAYAGHAPLWHGWAIMEAFLAGIDYARATDAATAAENSEAIDGPKEA